MTNELFKEIREYIFINCEKIISTSVNTENTKTDINRKGKN